VEHVEAVLVGVVVERSLLELERPVAGAAVAPFVAATVALEANDLLEELGVGICPWCRCDGRGLEHQGQVDEEINGEEDVPVLLDGLPVDDGVTDGDAEIDVEKLG
jgi:hypothetical protein